MGIQAILATPISSGESARGRLSRTSSAFAPVRALVAGVLGFIVMSVLTNPSGVVVATMPTVIALCSGWLAFCLVTAGLSKLRWSRATVATS